MTDTINPNRLARITVRCALARWPLASVAVGVDGRRAGYVPAGKVKTFRVAPGVHFVSVRLGGRRVDHGPFTLAAGEEVGVVCGRRLWSPDGGHVLLRRLAYLLSQGAAAAVCAVGLTLSRYLILDLWSYLPETGFDRGLYDAILAATTPPGGFVVGLLLWPWVPTSLHRAVREDRRRRYFLTPEPGPLAGRPGGVMTPVLSPEL